MNLFSVADKLATPDRPSVILDAPRCVRAKDRLSQCDICARACPVDALHLNTPITLDAKACLACGLCLRVCPVGAYTGDDGTEDLLNCIARLPDASAIELACPRHPAPERGVNANATVICTSTCLASFGPAVYLRLLTNGVPEIIARLDACTECAIGRVQLEIARTLAAVGQLFPAHVSGVVEKPDPNAKTRQVYDVKTPPVSRRDFFRLMTSESVRTVARAFTSETDDAPSGRTPPRERRRLLNTLKQLAPNDALQNLPAPGLDVVRLSANDKCTACGVCARACPTGAMRCAASASNEYRLTCLVASCTDCGVCLDMCEPEALRRDGMPTIADLLAPEPQTLKSGRLKHCTKCNASFADHIAGDLCPVCDFRQRNPFGSWQPRARGPRRETSA